MAVRSARCCRTLGRGTISDSASRRTQAPSRGLGGRRRRRRVLEGFPPTRSCPTPVTREARVELALNVNRILRQEGVRMERARAFSLAEDLEDKGFDRISLWSDAMDWTMAVRLHRLNSDTLKDALNTVELDKAQVHSAMVTESGNLDINSAASRRRSAISALVARGPGSMAFHAKRHFSASQYLGRSYQTTRTIRRRTAFVRSRYSRSPPFSRASGD